MLQWAWAASSLEVGDGLGEVENIEKLTRDPIETLSSQSPQFHQRLGPNERLWSQGHVQRPNTLPRIRAMDAYVHILEGAASSAKPALEICFQTVCPERSRAGRRTRISGIRTRRAILTDPNYSSGTSSLEHLLRYM